MASADVLNLPNALSALRVGILPWIITLRLSERPWAATVVLILFILAVLSDFLDGLLARRKGMETRVGAFLDPLCDKVFFLSLLIALIGHEPHPPWLTIPVFLILTREISVAALVGVAASQGVALRRPRTSLFKGISQFLALAFLLVVEVRLPVAAPWACTVLWIATGLSLVSAGEYIADFMRHPSQPGFSEGVAHE